MSTTDRDTELGRRLAATTRFRRFVHVQSCASTQDLAADPSLGADDGPGRDDAPGAGRSDGALFWADEQTHGRGRHGRTWHGAPDLDVEVTFRLVADVRRDPARLATAIPTAILDTLERVAAQRLTLKWPNDVLCHGRKLCGVLIDADGNRRSASGGARYRIGVGVNANRTEFPPELRERATSLALTSGHVFDRHDLVGALATDLEACVTGLERDRDDAALASLFADRLELVGRRVHIAGADLDLEGVLTAIDLTAATLDDARRVELAHVTRLARA